MPQSTNGGASASHHGRREVARAAQEVNGDRILMAGDMAGDRE